MVLDARHDSPALVHGAKCDVVEVNLSTKAAGGFFAVVSGVVTKLCHVQVCSLVRAGIARPRRVDYL